MKPLPLLLAVVLSLAAVACGDKAPVAAKTASIDPQCFELAGRYQGIDPNVLRAIAVTNDPTMQATVTRNKNGTVNIGPMGINEVNFPELAKQGVFPTDLLDQCKNVYVGAWYLKSKIIQHGNTWVAVGAYRSETPAIRDAYARQVREAWMRLMQTTKQPA